MNPEPPKKRRARPFKADWANVDWTQTNASLVQVYKCCPATVVRNRALFGHPRIDWSSIDWSKTNKAIHLQTGAATQTIANSRCRHAPETVPSHAILKRLAEIDWHQVDWSIPTGKLAGMLGIPRNRLYPKRCEYAPETVERRQIIPDDLELDWSLSDSKLARCHNLCYESVRIRRRAQAPETVKSHTDWSTVDWSLTNEEICRQTRNTLPTVIKHRANHAADSLKRSPRHDKSLKWRAINWSLSNKEILRLTGASIATIAKYRRQLAPETVKPSGRQRKQ